MLPGVLSIISFVSLAFFIPIITFLLPKKIGYAAEIISAIVILVYLFMNFSFTEAMMLISLMALAYGNLGIILDKDKQNRRRQLKQELIVSDYETIKQGKDMKRITVDVLIALLVSAGAVLFLIFAPETYALLKFIIGIFLLTTLTQLIARAADFSYTKLYFLPQQERLVIVSAFESRDLPLRDIKEVHRESAPDLLRLHPLFTFLSENKDYTMSFLSVLRLSFPGENIYLTPDDVEGWQERLAGFAASNEEKREKKILPLWHPKNLKRLIWKGYFAITVKGISAYTGLLFILIWLDVSPYIMISFVLLWWLFNLYVSDRVLVAASDAVEVTKGELYDQAKTIFKQAGIAKTRLYLIDSPIYNGLATGMNIGRGTIMLTTATTKLSMDAVKAIVAHEAIHIKKRDVLTNQIARMLFFGFLAAVINLFFDQLVLLSDHLVVFIIFFYILMLVFPMYLSFVAQWMEIRADHLGAKLLESETEQMGNGLRELGNAQDQAVGKTLKYSTNDAKPLRNKPSAARDSWFIRFLEFQFQPYPPLYWRIYCLSSSLNWRETKKAWMAARWKESLPDFLRKKVQVK
ncbi:M56 family metallopeptidase [Virgibacillus sp. C22-A2]|uniref:M56 family metallopeptidase n=1 Tax=Virgibacillus tibetensis TaxID=3042313 RepID=A0ABU6KHH7_9BACI|nr:M56 family metallopeptidase [Virgibacillus sp. C22-A2]